MKNNRRDFIKKTGMASAFTMLPTTGLFSNEMVLIENKNGIPTPTRAQLRWQEAEVGMLFHFDISIASGLTNFGNNTNRKRIDTQLYNPTKLDTDQWVAVAKSAGAKYAIFTATHFQGFMQWQSDLYPYGLKQAKWRNGKGDIIADFVASCRKAGLMPGIYFSTHRNVYWEVWDHYVNWGKGKGTSKQKEYNRIATAQARELFSKYGDIIQVWMDAGTKTMDEGGPNVQAMFEKYQPNGVFYHNTSKSDHRWIGNEAGYAGYPCWATMPRAEDAISHNSKLWKPILNTGDPDGEIWSPGCVDVPVRGSNGIHNWFWKEGQDHGLNSKEKLVKMYYDSVGRNSNLILGEVIAPDGLVPEIDAVRMKEFGEEIKHRFSNPVTTISGTGKKIVAQIIGKQKIDQVVLMEDISQGERIRAFKVEGKTDNGWKVLAKGSCIGHKYIGRFDVTEVSSLRLVVEESNATPVIKKLSVYNTAKA